MRVNLDTSKISLTKGEFAGSGTEFNIMESGGTDGSLLSVTKKNGKLVLLAKNASTAEQTVTVRGGDTYFGGRDVVHTVAAGETAVFAIYDTGEYLIGSGENTGKILIDTSDTEVGLTVVELP